MLRRSAKSCLVMRVYFARPSISSHTTRLRRWSTLLRYSRPLSSQWRTSRLWTCASSSTFASSTRFPSINKGYQRPKHHFLSHIALDIWRFGPPRGYWCFGFESFNKIIKRGAKRSNFKNETVSCMRYWSMWHGRKHDSHLHDRSLG